jgi:hypothetical protein
MNRRASLGRKMKNLGIVTARKRNCPVAQAPEAARDIVHRQVLTDTNCKKGPAYIQETLQRQGVHIPL